MPRLFYTTLCPKNYQRFKFSADIQQMWKKLQTDCILSAPILSTRVTVYTECKKQNI